MTTSASVDLVTSHLALSEDEGSIVERDVSEVPTVHDALSGCYASSPHRGIRGVEGARHRSVERVGDAALVRDANLNDCTARAPPRMHHSYSPMSGRPRRLLPGPHSAVAASSPPQPNWYGEGGGADQRAHRGETVTGIDLGDSSDSIRIYVDEDGVMRIRGHGQTDPFSFVYDTAEEGADLSPVGGTRRSRRRSRSADTSELHGGSVSSASSSDGTLFSGSSSDSSVYAPHGLPPRHRRDTNPRQDSLLCGSPHYRRVGEGDRGLTSADVGGEMSYSSGAAALTIYNETPLSRHHALSRRRRLVAVNGSSPSRRNMTQQGSGWRRSRYEVSRGGGRGAYDEEHGTSHSTAVLSSSGVNTAGVSLGTGSPVGGAGGGFNAILRLSAGLPLSTGPSPAEKVARMREHLLAREAEVERRCLAHRHTRSDPFKELNDGTAASSGTRFSRTGLKAGQSAEGNAHDNETSTARGSRMLCPFPMALEELHRSQGYPTARTGYIPWRSARTRRKDLASPQLQELTPKGEAVVYVRATSLSTALAGSAVGDEDNTETAVAGVGKRRTHAGAHAPPQLPLPPPPRDPYTGLPIVAAVSTAPIPTGTSVFPAAHTLASGIAFFRDPTATPASVIALPPSEQEEAHDPRSWASTLAEVHSVDSDGSRGFCPPASLSAAASTKELEPDLQRSLDPWNALTASFADISYQLPSALQPSHAPTALSSIPALQSLPYHRSAPRDFSGLNGVPSEPSLASEALATASRSTAAAGVGADDDVDLRAAGVLWAGKHSGEDIASRNGMRHDGIKKGEPIKQGDQVPVHEGAIGASQKDERAYRPITVTSSTLHDGEARNYAAVSSDIAIDSLDVSETVGGSSPAALPLLGDTGQPASASVLASRARSRCRLQVRQEETFGAEGSELFLDPAFDSTSSTTFSAIGLEKRGSDAAGVAALPMRTERSEEDVTYRWRTAHDGPTVSSSTAYHDGVADSIEPCTASAVTPGSGTAMLPTALPLPPLSRRIHLPVYPPSIAPYAAPRYPLQQNIRYGTWTAEGVSASSSASCIVHVFTVSKAMLRSLYEYVAYMCVATRIEKLQRRRKEKEKAAAKALAAGVLTDHARRCLRCPHCGTVGRVTKAPGMPQRGSGASNPTDPDSQMLSSRSRRVLSQHRHPCRSSESYVPSTSLESALQWPSGDPRCLPAMPPSRSVSHATTERSPQQHQEKNQQRSSIVTPPLSQMSAPPPLGLSLPTLLRSAPGGRAGEADDGKTELTAPSIVDPIRIEAAAEAGPDKRLLKNGGVVPQSSEEAPESPAPTSEFRSFSLQVSRHSAKAKHRYGSLRLLSVEDVSSGGPMSSNEDAPTSSAAFAPARAAQASSSSKAGALPTSAALPSLPRSVPALPTQPLSLLSSQHEDEAPRRRPLDDMVVASSSSGCRFTSEEEAPSALASASLPQQHPSTVRYTRRSSLPPFSDLTRTASSPAVPPSVTDNRGSDAHLLDGEDLIGSRRVNLCEQRSSVGKMRSMALGNRGGFEADLDQGAARPLSPTVEMVHKENRAATAEADNAALLQRPPTRDVTSHLPTDPVVAPQRAVRAPGASSRIDLRRASDASSDAENGQPQQLRAAAMASTVAAPFSQRRSTLLQQHPHSVSDNSFGDVVVASPSLPTLMPTNASAENSMGMTTPAPRTPAVAGVGWADSPSKISTRSPRTGATVRLTTLPQPVAHAQQGGTGCGGPAVNNGSDVNSLNCSVVASTLMPAGPFLARSPTPGPREGVDGEVDVMENSQPGNAAARPSADSSATPRYVCVACHRDVVPMLSQLSPQEERRHRRLCKHKPPGGMRGDSNRSNDFSQARGLGEGGEDVEVDFSLLSGRTLHRAEVREFNDLLRDDAFLRVMQSYLQDSLMMPTTAEPKAASQAGGFEHAEGGSSKLGGKILRDPSERPHPGGSSESQLPPPLSPDAFISSSATVSSGASESAALADGTAPFQLGKVDSCRGHHPVESAHTGSSDAKQDGAAVPVAKELPGEQRSEDGCNQRPQRHRDKQRPTAAGESPLSLTSFSTTVATTTASSPASCNSLTPAKETPVASYADAIAATPEVGRSRAAPLLHFSVPCCGLVVSALPFIADSQSVASSEGGRGDGVDGTKKSKEEQRQQRTCGAKSGSLSRRSHRRRGNIPGSTVTAHQTTVPRMREDAATRGLTPSAIFMREQAARRGTRGRGNAISFRVSRCNEPWQQHGRRCSPVDSGAATMSPMATSAPPPNQTTWKVAFMTKGTISSEKHRIRVNPRFLLDAVSKDRIMKRIFREERNTTGSPPAAAGAGAATAAAHPSAGRAKSSAGAGVRGRAVCGDWSGDQRTRSYEFATLSASGAAAVEPLAGPTSESSSDSSATSWQGREAPSSWNRRGYRGHCPSRHRPYHHRHSQHRRQYHRGQEALGKYLSAPEPLGMDLRAYSDSSLVLEIDVAYPRLHRGNVRQLLEKWMATYVPHPVLVETVIRNILYAVLVQLATLHAAGCTHGSVKATNVFPLWHAMEGVRECGLTMPPRQTHEGPSKSLPRVAPRSSRDGVDVAEDRKEEDSRQCKKVNVSETPLGFTTNPTAECGTSPSGPITIASPPAQSLPFDLHAQPATNSTAVDFSQFRNTCAATPGQWSHRRPDHRPHPKNHRASRATGRGGSTSVNRLSGAPHTAYTTNIRAGPTRGDTAPFSPFKTSFSPAGTAKTGLAAAMAAFRRDSTSRISQCSEGTCEARDVHQESGVHTSRHAETAREPPHSFPSSVPLAPATPSTTRRNSVRVNTVSPRPKKSYSASSNSGDGSIKSLVFSSESEAAASTNWRRHRNAENDGDQTQQRRGSLNSPLSPSSSSRYTRNLLHSEEDQSLIPLVAEVLTRRTLDPVSQRGRYSTALPRTAAHVSRSCHSSGVAPSVAAGGSSMLIGSISTTATRSAAPPPPPLAKQPQRPISRAAREDDISSSWKADEVLEEWLMAAAPSPRYVCGVQLQHPATVSFPTSTSGELVMGASKLTGQRCSSSVRDTEAIENAARGAAALPVLTAGPSGAAPRPMPDHQEGTRPKGRAVTTAPVSSDRARPALETTSAPPLTGALSTDNCVRFGDALDPLQWSRQVLLTENVSSRVAAALRTAMATVLQRCPPYTHEGSVSPPVRRGRVPSLKVGASVQGSPRGSLPTTCSGHRESVLTNGVTTASSASHSCRAYLPDVLHTPPPSQPALFAIQESEYVPAPELIRTATDEMRALWHLSRQQWEDFSNAEVRGGHDGNTGEVLSGGYSDTSPNGGAEPAEAPELLEHLAAVNRSPVTVLRNTLDPYPATTAAADIWQLGMMALDLADGPTPSSWIQQREPLLSLRAYPWSSHFYDFVTQCLQRSPQQRSTAAQLLEHEWFQVALMPQPIPPSPAEPPRADCSPWHYESDSNLAVGNSEEQHGAVRMDRGRQRGLRCEPLEIPLLRSPKLSLPLPPPLMGVMGVSGLTKEEKEDWERYDYLLLYAAGSRTDRPRTTAAAAVAAAAAAAVATGVGNVEVNRYFENEPSARVESRSPLKMPSAVAPTTELRCREAAAALAARRGGAPPSLPGLPRFCHDASTPRNTTPPISSAVALAPASPRINSVAPARSTEDELIGLVSSAGLAQNFSELISQQWLQGLHNFGVPFLYTRAAQHDGVRARANYGAVGVTPVIESSTGAEDMSGNISPWPLSLGAPRLTANRALGSLTPRSVLRWPLTAPQSVAMFGMGVSAAAAQPRCSEPITSQPSSCCSREGMTTPMSGALSPSVDSVASFGALGGAAIPARASRVATAQIAHTLPEQVGTGLGCSRSSGLPGYYIPLHDPFGHNWMNLPGMGALAGHCTSPVSASAKPSALPHTVLTAGGVSEWGGQGDTALFRRFASAREVGESDTSSRRDAGMHSACRDEGRCPCIAVHGASHPSWEDWKTASLSSTLTSDSSDSVSSGGSSQAECGDLWSCGYRRGALAGRSAAKSNMGSTILEGYGEAAAAAAMVTSVGVMNSSANRGKVRSSTPAVTSCPLFHEGHTSVGCTTSSVPVTNGATGAASLPKERAIELSKPSKRSNHRLLSCIGTSLARLSILAVPLSDSEADETSSMSSRSLREYSENESSDQRAHSPCGHVDVDLAPEASLFQSKEASGGRHPHAQDNDVDSACAEQPVEGSEDDGDADGSHPRRVETRVLCDELLGIFSTLQQSCPSAVSLWCLRVLQEAAREPRLAVKASQLLAHMERKLPADRVRALGWLRPTTSKLPGSSLNDVAAAAEKRQSSNMATIAVEERKEEEEGGSSTSMTELAWPASPSLAMAFPPPELDVSPSTFHFYETAKWVHAMQQALPRCV